MADDSEVPVAPVTALSGHGGGSPVFNGHGVTPFVEMDRAAWAALAESTPLPLTGAEIERLRGLATRSTSTRCRRSTCRCPGC